MQASHRPNTSVHWISHRGYHKQFVENSKEAFDEACARGFTHLETDLRVTRDGVLVLCHDPDLVRLGGSKQAVSTYTAAELAGISLPGGGAIMAFEDFYQRYNQRCLITLDFKPEQGEATVRAFIQWVERHNAEEWVRQRVTFLFWNAAHEAAVKAAFPGARCYGRQLQCIRLGLALLAGLPGLGGIEPGRIYAMPPSFLGKQLYTRKYVDAVHRYNGKVVAFLPETEVEVRAALAAGVDEVLTNGEIFK